MKKFLLFLLGFITAIALSEILLRCAYRPYVLNPQKSPDSIAWMQQYVSLNNDGYRDKNYSLNKPENTFRIYTIGDSYTFGWYIDNPQNTFPEIIEKELQKKTKMKIEVINAGFWGFNMYEEVNRFAWEGKRYHPDIVLLGLNHFEANLPDINFYRKDHFLPRVIQLSYLYDFLVGKYFREESDRKNYEQQLRVFSEPNSRSWNTFEQQVFSLKKEVEKSGAKLVFLLFPYIHPLNANVPYDFYVFHEKMRLFGKENGIIIVDPLDDFLAYRDKNELSLTPVDSHPTIKMNHLVAKSFIKQFPSDSYQNTLEKKSITETATLSKNNMDIGDYMYIRNITSSTSSLPFVYFEEKSGDFQELPVQKPSHQPSILPDKIITKPQEFSPQLRHYAYPQEKGILTIPKNAYGYRIIGFKQFYGILKKNQHTIQFNPSLIKEVKNDYIITYDPKYNFSVIRTILYIEANQIDVNTKGKINDVKRVVVINTIAPKETNKISVPFHGEIIATPKLDTFIQLKKIALRFPVILQTLKKLNILTSSNRLSPLAKKVAPSSYNSPSVFVNGIYTQTTGIIHERDILTINFNKPLKKGSRITLAVLASLRLNNEEAIEITIERKIKETLRVLY